MYIKNLVFLTNSSFGHPNIDVYISKYTREHCFTISRPFTVMSFGSPKPKPIK